MVEVGREKVRPYFQGVSLSYGYSITVQHTSIIIPDV